MSRTIAYVPGGALAICVRRSGKREQGEIGNRVRGRERAAATVRVRRACSTSSKERKEATWSLRTQEAVALRRGREDKIRVDEGAVGSRGRVVLENHSFVQERKITHRETSAQVVGHGRVGVEEAVSGKQEMEGFSVVRSDNTVANFVMVGRAGKKGKGFQESEGRVVAFTGLGFGGKTRRMRDGRGCRRRSRDVGAVGVDEKRGITLECGGSTAVPIVATPGADEADGGGRVASGAFAKGSASAATAAASAAGAGNGATGSSVGLGRRARCGACGGGGVGRLTGLQKRRATKAAALEAGEPSSVETVIKDSSSEASTTVAGQSRYCACLSALRALRSTFSEFILRFTVEGKFFSVYDEKRKREESRMVVHDQEEVTRSRRSRTTTAILAPFA
ncbi:hypothetical protein B0H17DRAFT_1134818 [Mycena rosella]|uniref:Uncharacterized protein n=1 Tax=Mycena rosella TaxID=1033263 RepID=A0AAD7DF48_MYCRO|nr:hypothetical protein B0H17DRAFT_1134818 [Mycena rosella]